MNSRIIPRLSTLLAFALLAVGCTRADPPGAYTPPLAASAQGRLSPSAIARPAASASDSLPSATVLASAAVTAADAGTIEAKASGPDGGAQATSNPADPQNKARPANPSPLMEAHARALLDAIIHDEVDRARDFFFPREPFTPLKDVKDADRYWRQLYAVYKRDVHEQHIKRRDWTGAEFDSFELGSQPRWVKPGEEANKIGYYRTFDAQLRYKIQGKRHLIKVQVIISWNGEWYITHLAPIRH